MTIFDVTIFEGTIFDVTIFDVTIFEITKETPSKISGISLCFVSAKCH